MKLVRLIKICLNENYSKDHIGTHLCDPSDGLKQGDALRPLLFNFAVECAIRKIQENGVGLKLNGTHHLLVYDDANLLKNNINIIKIKTGALISASKKVGLKVNTDKTKYVYINVSSPECKEKS
jgi:hypothetical protein